MKSILVILFKIVIIIKVIIVIIIFIIVIIVISNLVTDTEPSNGAVSEAVALFATLLNIRQDAIISDHSCQGAVDDDSQGYGWPGSNRGVCKSHKSSQSLALCSRTTLLIVIMLILMMKMVFMMMLVILMMKVMAVMLPLAVCRHTTLIGIITC